MAGITSYGAYIPFYRMNRAEIAKAWDTPPAPGEDLVEAGMATVASLRSEMLNELRRLKKYMQKPPA